MATLAFWILFLCLRRARSRRRWARRVQLIAAAPQHLLPRQPRIPDQPLRASTSCCSGARSRSGRSPASCTRSCSGASSRSAATRSLEFLYGLGLVDLTHARLVPRLSPGADAVRRGGAARHHATCSSAARSCVRSALGTKVSVESIVIALFIATLMITFLLTFRLEEGSGAERVNWWIHMTVILAFMALIPASKHLHLVLSPVTVFLKSTGARQPAEPRLREGTGRARDGEGSRQQERARRVHLRRVRPLPGELSRRGAPARRSIPRRSSCRRRARCSPATSEQKLGEVLLGRRCCGSARPAARARTSARSASSTCRF